MRIGYGWLAAGALAIVVAGGYVASGHLRAVERCDQLAAYPLDPEVEGAGVPSVLIDYEAAIPACERAVWMAPEIGRLKIQLARALLRKEEVTQVPQAWMPMAQQALEQRHPLARGLVALGYMSRQLAPDQYAPARARELLDPAHTSDEPLAIYLRGYLYHYGIAVERDMARAKRHYELAWSKGVPGAAVQLARMYAEGHGSVRRNPEQAYALVDKAAQGSAFLPAILRKAQYLENGTGVTADLSDARFWYGVAAKYHSTMGAREFARMHAEGLGGARDYREARRWYEVAAERGDWQAQLVLAGWLVNGDKPGVPLDPEAGIAWAKAAQEAPEANALLARVYREGLGVTADRDRAADYALRASPTAQAVMRPVWREEARPSLAKAYMLFLYSVSAGSEIRRACPELQRNQGAERVLEVATMLTAGPDLVIGGFDGTEEAAEVAGQLFGRAIAVGALAGRGERDARQALASGCASPVVRRYSDATRDAMVYAAPIIIAEVCRRPSGQLSIVCAFLNALKQ